MPARRRRSGRRAASLALLALAGLAAGSTAAEPGAEPRRERGELLAIARELMAEAGFCALVTLDETGAPRARAMDPLPPEDGLVVWLATNPASRKVEQIRRDPRVVLFYLAPASGAYVTLHGRARLVADPADKAQLWKEGWERFYPDREEGLLLIRVAPERLELISERHGIVGDPATWRPPAVDFSGAAAADPRR